jgi:hypothetical protein
MHGEKIADLVASLQRGLRANDVLTRFSRVCFFLMLGLCLAALGFKFMGHAFPGALAVLAVAISIGVSLPAWWRYSPQASAILVDRRLGLHERLSTCLENLSGPATPLVEAQRRDTLCALEAADLDEVRRLRSPRELMFAGAFALGLAFILVAPQPVRSDAPPPENKALQVDAAQLKRMLETMRRQATPRAQGAVETLDRILSKLSTSDPGALEEHLRTLAAERKGLLGSLEDPSLSEGEKARIRRILDFLSGAGRRLARHTDPARVPEELFAPSPSAERKVEALARVVETAAPAAPISASEETPAPARGGWDPRFDDLVRKFYGERR